ncbi:MAG TPA: DUF1987 domain-containing protein [Bacteroidales bacterium]|nr:DUF1987 domain-containing protein [Bacteroidales bacterium]
MKNLNFEPTTSTPAVRFTIDGRLLIEGRSLPENVSRFYEPLIKWAKELDAEVVKMDLNLEYLNSASSKKVLEILRAIDRNTNIKVFIVNWHYEADDEDALESGQIFEDLLDKAEFRYHEYSEAA